MDLPTLNTEGFLITAIAGAWTIASADFGDGYGAAALKGLPEGLRSWTMRAAAIPDDRAAKLADDFGGNTYVLRETAIGYVLAENGGRLIIERAFTRAAYLWRFFQTSKAAGDRPFWIEMEDPATGTRQNYLATFAADRLSYEVLCAKVYGTGLELSERRLPPGVARRRVRP